MTLVLIHVQRNFIISRFTPQMFNSMGPSGCGVFYFFASMMILSFPFVWFLGKSNFVIFNSLLHRWVEVITCYSPRNKRHSSREHGSPV